MDSFFEVMNMSATIQIKSVTVTGGTAWAAEEYKDRRCGRGVTMARVDIKDPSGRPAYKAQRVLGITITTADGIAYRFTQTVLAGGYVSSHCHKTIECHGMSHTIEKVPQVIADAHERARIRCTAILRAMRAEFQALPQYRPRAA